MGTFVVLSIGQEKRANKHMRCTVVSTMLKSQIASASAILITTATATMGASRLFAAS
jgi:hypothetical protein